MARILIGNIMGPQGPQGIQGPTGPQGPQGPQGPLPPLINNSLQTTPGVGALDAVMGSVFGGQITQLNSDLNNLSGDIVRYRELWTGTLTAGGTATISGIAAYNTFAIVASSYPAVLWGHRWGTKVNAFGFDGNASNAFRLMSVILTLNGDKITVTKAKTAPMAFGAVNGAVSDFTITQIYGLT